MTALTASHKTKGVGNRAEGQRVGNPALFLPNLRPPRHREDGSVTEAREGRQGYIPALLASICQAYAADRQTGVVLSRAYAVDMRSPDCFR
jgi:hypothetical protein